MIKRVIGEMRMKIGIRIKMIMMRIKGNENNNRGGLE